MSWSAYDDVGRAEEGEPAGDPQPHRAAAQAADREQAADHPDQEQVRGRVDRADQHDVEIALRRREHGAQRRGQRGRGAGGAERPVQPQRPREGPVVAAHEADDRGGDERIEAEVGEVGGRRDGRVGLELEPRRDDHVAGRLREHREPEPDRRGAARTAQPRAGEARDRRDQHREVADPAVRGVVGRAVAADLEHDQPHHVQGQQHGDRRAEVAKHRCEHRPPSAIAEGRLLNPGP